MQQDESKWPVCVVESAGCSWRYSAALFLVNESSLSETAKNGSRNDSKVPDDRFIILTARKAGKAV